MRAVVTGAASGMGRATAERLVREGVEVIAVDLRDPGVAGAQDYVCDVGDPAARERLARDAGAVDYLVNAAGIIHTKPIWEVQVEDWRRLQIVNAESVFFLCQLLGRSIPDGGAIVNLSSVSAKLSATIELASYAATKTTILSITRSFAYALAPRVRVNAICPGIVDTPMQEAVLEEVAPLRGLKPDELSDARTKAVLLGRTSTPDEAATLIWFMLHDAVYMTGQAVNWTGGMITW
jgi:NAD(P)-dependent dehydrogenase (short-subunit alcohol dehydrogenase family)